jgi:hypothetical protein
LVLPALRKPIKGISHRHRTKRARRPVELNRERLNSIVY